MKKFCIDQDSRVEVYSEARFRDILEETWGKVEEVERTSEDGDECHEEYVKFGHTVGAWHEDGGFGWVEMPHWFHGESLIYF
jgi:hypothetical protein